MRKFVSIVVLAAAVIAAPIAYAQTPPASGSSAKPAAQKPAAASNNMATHSTNGTVKSVDASSLVITKPGAKAQEMTFVLDPSTQKQGTLEVGSMVTVRYKTEGSTMTATAVTAKPAKGGAAKK